MACRGGFLHCSPGSAAPPLALVAGGGDSAWSRARVFSVFAAETACSKGVHHEKTQLSPDTAVSHNSPGAAPPSPALTSTEPPPRKVARRQQTCAEVTAPLFCGPKQDDLPVPSVSLTPPSLQHLPGVDASDASDPEFDEASLSPCSHVWEYSTGDALFGDVPDVPRAALGGPPLLQAAWSVDEGFALLPAGHLAQTPLLSCSSPGGAMSHTFTFDD